MSDDRKPIGSRWRFDSVHWSVAHLAGEVCTVVEHDAGQWPYVVARADGQTWPAVDRELVPVDAMLEPEAA